MNVKGLSVGEKLVLDTLGRMGPAGACQSIGDVKSRLVRMVRGGLINACVWSLAERGLVNLFRHDYPAGMTSREKTRALQVGDVYYNGVSLREGEVVR